MIKIKYFLVLLCDMSLVYSVPPDYCNRPLNTSNCQGKPTRVFAYYKPGSRCEIETWRGCPTYNKFPSEIACVNLCIFRFNGKRAEVPRVKNKEEKMEYYDDIIDEDSTENNIPKLCQGKLNTTKCQNTPKSVFTYDHDEEQCVQANWYVCPTKNMFNTLQHCAKTCEDQNGDLAQFLKKRTTNDFVLLDKLLNDIVDNIAVVNESEDVNEIQKPHNEVIVTEAIDTTMETENTSKSTIAEKSTETAKTGPVTEDLTTITTTFKPTESTEYNNEIDSSDEVKSTTKKETQETTVTEASVATEIVIETEKTTMTQVAKAETSKATQITSTAPPKSVTSKVTETVKPETSKVTESDKPKTSPGTSKATEPTSRTSTVKIRPTEVIILSDDENGMPV